MSASQVLFEIQNAPNKITDPGDAGTITVDRALATVDLVSATAETRTLGRPVREGSIVSLHHLTDGGDITLTVTGGYNVNGDTTFTFSAVGQYAVFKAFHNGSAYFWRLIDHYGFGNISPVDIAMIDADNAALATTAGTGITAGTGTVYKNSVIKVGGIITTRILIDLTGLNSKNTDGDIIGVDGTTNPCHLGQITAARNGTIFGGIMRCLEVPAGGDPNIALYSATEATGVEDGAISSLTETVIFDPNADWTVDMSRTIASMPAADEYLYLVQGDATGTDATYTAGKFLIELYGY